MARARLLAAAAILALLVGAAGALAWWSAAVPRAGEATVRLEVVGPDGPLFNGTVRLANATAYTALLAANLTLQVDEYPGMGIYVRAIGPYAAHGASGWIFAVDRGAGWVEGDRSAARFALHDGDALRWSWTDG